MSKTTIKDIIKAITFSFISCFLFLAEFLIATGQNLEMMSIIVIIASGTVLPLVYFRLKKGAKHSVIFTVLSAIVYVAAFVCAYFLLKPHFTKGYDQLLLSISYYMNFLIFLGIFVVDIVGLICSAIKKILSKLSIQISAANCSLHRFTAILISGICVLCIYLLTSFFSNGVDEMLAASFIPSFFSSVYYLSKANSSNPKLYFYSLLISHAAFGIPTLVELINKFYMHFAENIYLDLYDLRIAVYLSVVFLIVADAVQTFILDKKVTTNGSTEDPVR